MKNKMIKIILSVVIIFAIVLGIWFVCAFFFQTGPTFPFLSKQLTPSDSDVDFSDLIAEDQLMALVEDEESAKQIAEMYEITLVSYAHGVAIYHTDDDPFKIIVEGAEAGYPELSLNYINSYD